MTPPLSPPARALLVVLRGNGEGFMRWRPSDRDACSELIDLKLARLQTPPCSVATRIYLTRAGRAWKETTP